ncbi:MAG: AraC family transcriptional regulator [Ruminococcaceae bacterium]|nr:AraC family transcriptional regulator [Oscillospiraceae bacterium]
MTEIVLSQVYGCNMDLYFCGERLHTPLHEFGPSTRTHFLISLVTEGQATLYGKKKNVTFRDGDFIIMFPDVAYHYQAKDLWSLKWVGVGSADLGIFLERLGINKDRPIVKCRDPQSAEQLFDRIRDMSSDATPSSVMRMKSLLCELVAIISESCEAQNRVSLSVRSAEILKIIAANYADELRVEDIARNYHLDRSYLERTFRRDTGKSIRETITDFRIKKAQSLLRDTDIPISDVAKSSGFGDRLYFSKFFHKKFGMTPSEYRKTSKAGADRRQKDDPVK